jgi:hypothetical protein
MQEILVDAGLLAAGEAEAGGEQAAAQLAVDFVSLDGGERPLLELLLIPVHLKLELVHLLVRLEDHILDVVQAVLLVGHALL